VALVPFWGMGLDGIWSKADLDFPLLPFQRVTRSFYVWDHYFSTGTPSIGTLRLNQIPQYFLYGLLDLIGVPVALINRLYIVGTWILLGSGAYLLTSALSTLPQKYTRLGALIASFYAMVNPYLVLRLYFGHLSILISLAFSYIVQAALIKGVKVSSKGSDGWFIYAIAGSFLTIFMSDQPAIFALSMFALTCVFLLEVLAVWKGGKKTSLVLKFGLTMFLLIVVFNLWWILPMSMDYVYSGVIKSLYTGGKFAESLTIAKWHGENLANSGGLLLVLRAQFLMTPLPDVNWYNNWVQSPPIIILGIVLSFLAVAIFLVRLHNVHAVILGLITIIALGFSVGVNPPFGSIFTWLIENFWWFHAYRVTDKFLHIAMFGYPVLLGVSAGYVLFTLSKIQVRKAVIPRILEKGSAVLIVLLIAMNAFPLFSGNLDGVMTPMRVPQYYSEARTWLLEQGHNYRILPVYTCIDTWWIQYDWAPSYNVVPITKEVFSVPTIGIRLGEEWHPSSQIIRQIYNIIVNNRSAKVGNLLNLLNIRFIVVQDDLSLLVDNKPQKIDLSNIKTVLDSQSDLKHVASFGKLDFYENKKWRDTSFWGVYYHYPAVSSNETNYLPDYALKKIAMSDTSIAFLPAELSEIHSENINVSSIEFWGNSYRVSQISLSSDGEIEDLPTIVAKLNVTAALNGHPAGTPPDGWVHLIYDDNIKRDWSEVSHISFWFKADPLPINRSVTNALNFYLADENEEWRQWIFTDEVKESGKLYKIRLPISNFFSESRRFDLSRVKYFRVSTNLAKSATETTVWFNGLELLRPLFDENKDEFREMPSINYEMIDPTRYVAHVESRSPFLLVFTETFDSNWHAQVKGVNATLTHELVNNFMNGWDVPLEGEYDIEISYQPQRYVEFGGIVFLAACLITVLISCRYYFRIKRESKKNAEE